jgi:AraC family transcriptional regulator of adaptative response / DNA-3-methyladenine glycosylase II
VELSPLLGPSRAQVVERVRRLFDLDADGDAVSAHLGRDPTMAPLVARRPGLRLPGTMDRFELAVRAVLGQQVSVAGANTIAGRLVRLVGARIPRQDGEAPAMLTHLPVAAERLAAARPVAIAGIGIPRARAACLVSLARAVADGELPELAGGGPAPEPEGFIRRFTALPGIGTWTAEYVAMRALGWRDAFPAGDLGLRKAMGGITEAALRGAAERWRPWRAYAAQHLWASLGDGKDGNRR